MARTILVDGKTYRHHSEMVPADGSPSPLAGEAVDRQSFFKDKKKLRLDRTAGAYVPLGGKNLLLVIDRNSVACPSSEWTLIAEAAQRLEASFATLSAQGKAALAALRAVIFSSKPQRSFADVRPDLFFYDTDELKRSDGSLVSASWAASCIVHDANHVWQHDNGKKFTGTKAETVCWQLQVDNAGPLGLDVTEVNHLKGFIADPKKILDRMKSKTF